MLGYQVVYRAAWLHLLCAIAQFKIENFVKQEYTAHFISYESEDVLRDTGLRITPRYIHDRM